MLTLLVLFSVSCTKEKRSEIIIREFESETTQSQSMIESSDEYR